MLYVKDLSVKAGNFTVQSVHFEIGEGEYFFLLGESGSGKTLILEAIAGITPVRGGSVAVRGRDVTASPVNKRDVGIVFQNLALFPHKTVFQNIAYSLALRGIEKKTIIREVELIAGRMSIHPLLKRYPGSLSGGEHQRVALARTLVMRPAVLLLDEPLSSLDILLKEEMLEALKEIHRQGQTILHVTHDYHEVAMLADRISIIANGRQVQTGTPEEIARDPKCRLAERIR